MKGKLLKRDDGRSYGFITSGVDFRRLCKSIAQFPGITFTNRRSFFWWSQDIHAAFTFKDNEFKIDPDSWDDSFWILPSQEEVTVPEIQDVLLFVERKLVTPTRPSWNSLLARWLHSR